MTQQHTISRRLPSKCTVQLIVFHEVAVVSLLLLSKIVGAAVIFAV